VAMLQGRKAGWSKAMSSRTQLGDFPFDTYSNNGSEVCEYDC